MIAERNFGGRAKSKTSTTANPTHAAYLNLGCRFIASSGKKRDLDAPLSTGVGLNSGEVKPGQPSLKTQGYQAKRTSTSKGNSTDSVKLLSGDPSCRYRRPQRRCFDRARFCGRLRCRECILAGKDWSNPQNFPRGDTEQKLRVKL